MLATHCCRDGLIRLIRAQPLSGTRRVTVLGVDLFRGSSYAEGGPATAVGQGGAVKRSE
jgi:hypothetical protein